MVDHNLVSKCLGKDKFVSKLQAIEIMKKQRRNSKKHRLIVYECELCGKFHIGSSMQRSKYVKRKIL